MCGRQSICAVCLVYVESLRALNTLQVAKAFQRHFARPSDELQQLCLFCLVKGSHCSPPPLDHRITRAVAMQLCVVLPSIDVNVRQARDEQFQLLLGEDTNQVMRNDVVKAIEKGVDLGDRVVSAPPISAKLGCLSPAPESTASVAAQSRVARTRACSAL